MGTGFLKVTVTAGSFLIPVVGAQVRVTQDGETRYDLIANDWGMAQIVSLSAPDAATTLDPNFQGDCYSRCDVTIGADNLVTKTIRNVLIFDHELTLLPVQLRPETTVDLIDCDRSGGAETAQSGLIDGGVLPEHALKLAAARRQTAEDDPGLFQPADTGGVVTPYGITVHLGAPDSDATNVTIEFREYIKRVCSYSVYPTWPLAALEASVYCALSVALNRLYAKWYSGRGYPFDITCQIGYDQYFVYQGGIFSNINYLVDQLFDRYVSKAGDERPFYTTYCDGVHTLCRGLSQWGSVELAKQGMDALSILDYYYPNGVRLQRSVRIDFIQSRYPGYVLSEGMEGEAVRMLQEYLNHVNFNIPAINGVKNVDGVFGKETDEAVKSFQAAREFGLSSVSGEVDKAEWYRIAYEHVRARRFNQLVSTGEVLGMNRTPPETTLTEGSSGEDIRKLQFVLEYISNFYPEVPDVAVSGIFARKTGDAVRGFQKAFGLPVDGVVNPAVWAKLYSVFWKINDSVDVPFAFDPVSSMDGRGRALVKILSRLWPI